ncbi:MAG: hypothetical protein K2W95_15550 [Candidatus Obscuribacterales bacterium]|nr:hypothetical protein [Candidatus Obscuribacterales bacterium]
MNHQERRLLHLIKVLAGQALFKAFKTVDVKSWCVNWADIKVVDVEYHETLNGESGYRAWISEANSPELEHYVHQYLTDHACPNVEVKTEW